MSAIARGHVDGIGQRLLRLMLFATAYAAIVAMRTSLFPHGRPAVTWTERVLQLGSWCWVAAAPAAFAGLVSLVSAPARRRTYTRRCTSLVSFRIVSRGRNAAALAETVGSIRAVMASQPLFRYLIEVVTDEPVDLPSGRDLRAYIVPSDYRTPNGSLFKARALHYLGVTSDLPSKAWIFHCDEESWATLSLVAGIRDAILEEEERAQAGVTPRIGQGTILYHRNLRKHPVLTLADMLRTGDDITRFYTQFRTGALFCGMHGSFILVRGDVERTVSFDVGPEGSVTEDAWWAYAQAYRGREFRWVDGYLLEQSPESWRDFIRQRRRWYSGLWKVYVYAPAPLLSRAALLGFLMAWAVSCVGGLYTVVNLFTGLTTPAVPHVVGAVVFAWYLATYLAGLHVNLAAMQEDERPRIPRRILLYAGQVLLMPIFGALEAAGVAYALMKPERGFHVVQKSPTARVASAT